MNYLHNIQCIKGLSSIDSSPTEKQWVWQQLQCILVVLFKHKNVFFLLAVKVQISKISAHLHHMDGTVPRDIHHSGGKVLLSSARNRQTSLNCYYRNCCLLKWLQTTQLLLVFPPLELRDGRKERQEGASPPAARLTGE